MIADLTPAYGPDTPPGDDLRILGGLSHCRGVRRGMLSVHAVAMEQDGRAVILFGGHGAGKSVTGVALAQHGWRAVAGDMATIQVAGHEARPLLVGGSRQYLLRPSSVQRCGTDASPAPVRSPGREARAGARIDVTNAVPWADEAAGELMLCMAASVAVDSGAGPGAETALMDDHTSVSVWFRASSHLLDRVLDEKDAEPLRCMEHPSLTVARMVLVRAAARALPVHAMFGTPQGIAAAVEASLTRRGYG